MKRKYFFSCLMALTFVGVGYSQTAEQFKNISKDYDKNKLQTMAENYARTYTKESIKAYDYAEQNNLPVEINKNGITSKLMRIDQHGNLLYRKSMNVESANMVGANKLYPNGDLGIELTGEGMIGGIWDGGRALLTHELLEHDITLKDESPQFGDHATHVAGTIIGRELSGQNSSQARGVAYEAKLHSYDWESDLAEMAQEASDGLLVSNHSYGLDLSQINILSTILGMYTDGSSAADALAYESPYYSIVTSAGNDRGGGINDDDGGHNLLGGEYTTAKNTIVVAAVEKNLNGYEGPENVVMSDFSSWGPTKDNRIKPDISAPGVAVFSSIQTGTSDYAYSSGTSMAAPVVSGGVILLQQLSAELNNGEFLKAATIKALIAQTAWEAGEHPGPDSRYGWGLLNIGDAAQLMIDNENNSGSFYKELTLNDGETYSKTITHNGENDLKVTIAWTDPAEEPQSFGNASVLINDLDLRITDSQGNTFYPWRLNDSYEGSALNDGDNSIDNIEQVLIPDAEQGEEYTITVSHKDQLESGKQDFSIVVLGSEPLSVDSHELKGVKLYPNPATDQINIDLEQSDGAVDLQVNDLNGRKVLTQKINNYTSSYQLDISHLDTGVYFVEIKTKGKKAVKKLIVK